MFDRSAYKDIGDMKLWELDTYILVLNRRTLFWITKLEKIYVLVEKKRFREIYGLAGPSQRYRVAKWVYDQAIKHIGEEREAREMRRDRYTPHARNLNDEAMY